MNDNEEIGYNPILHEQIHNVVENQIRMNNPKETTETLERLMNLGYSRHEAIHKIGTVVVKEIFDVEKNKEPYNEKRYVKRLLELK
jgi:uncharacterized protein with ATP-grasp and redox domains